MALLSGSSEGGCLVVIGGDVAIRQDLSDRPVLGRALTIKAAGGITIEAAGGLTIEAAGGLTLPDDASRAP